MKAEYEKREERRLRNKYIEETYPELKNLNSMENAKYYTSYMAEYYELHQTQFKSIVGEERVENYNKLKEELTYLRDKELIKFTINERKNGDVGITIIFGMLVHSDKTPDLVGKIVGKILYTFDEYLLQPINKNEMKLSFDVELTDKILIKSYEKELKELGMKMKYLLSQRHE